ncbi:MAG: PLP-dependent aminotransferase family protein [Ktedonobacteraceae bacterium]|nr:PLP-dependent aminotransferase family protein [Ktedonobacteraceae bacterium]
MMPRVVSHPLFLTLTLDPTSSLPLYRQLADALRQAILTGQLAAGTQLPSTRLCARSLGISRFTVLTAFEQLFAEGYISSKGGSGTYVADVLPDERLHLAEKPPTAMLASDQKRLLSRRGALLGAGRVLPEGYGKGESVRAFRPGLPAFDHFPFDIWRRLMTKHWRHPPPDLLSYSDPAGFQPLREQITAYLKAARGVQCEAGQVIIVSGSQQALELAVRLLLDPGDAAWIEDPGYLGARAVFQGTGTRVIPVPVDAQGLDVSQGIALGADARLAYVTPSHQFPLGVTMSLARRLALLRWAKEQEAWILEDDYDSEYRYRGRPLPSLQGLDPTGRVIYIGTFSKVLFPGIRLGYLVVPADLVDAFVAARAVVDRQPPILDQLVLADFLSEGHFGRHLRRMRTLYEERQAILVEAITSELSEVLTVSPAPAGMHLVGGLAEGISAQQISREAAHQRLIVPPLSAYACSEIDTQALLLGYTAFDAHVLRQGVQHLARALERIRKR